MNSANFPTRNIEEVMLPSFYCPYCNNINYWLGSKCSTCWARLTIQDKEKMEIPSVFSALDMDIPEEHELYERNQSHYGWIDSTGMYNMNLPKDYDGSQEVKAEWSGEVYQEWVHILPMKVLIGFWVDDDGTPWDEGELWKMWEALQLLQFAILKAMKKDAEEWVSSSFKNCHKLLLRIENKKKKSGILKNGLRDIDDLIEFLENYINGFSPQSIKNVGKKVRRRSQATIEKTTGPAEWEWNEWAILAWVGLTSILAATIYLAITNKTFSINVWDMSSFTTITVQEKQWLDRYYTLAQYVPGYNKSAIGKPTSSDISYSKKPFDDADKEYERFEKIRDSYNPYWHFHLWNQERIDGKTVSIPTWYIEVTPMDCPEPKEYAPPSSIIDTPAWPPPVKDNNGGNGFWFWSGGSINRAGLDSFSLFVSPAYADSTEEDCDIKEEVILRAPIQYDVQNYSYWDFWPEKRIRNQKPIIGNIPQRPYFTEDENHRIIHDKTKISYYLELFEWDTRRVLEISSEDDWHRLSKTWVCEVTMSKLRYLFSWVNQWDLEKCQ